MAMSSSSSTVYGRSSVMPRASSSSQNASSPSTSKADVVVAAAPDGDHRTVGLREADVDARQVDHLEEPVHPLHRSERIRVPVAHRVDVVRVEVQVVVLYRLRLAAVLDQLHLDAVGRQHVGDAGALLLGADHAVVHVAVRQLLRRDHLVAAGNHPVEHGARVRHPHAQVVQRRADGAAGRLPLGQKHQRVRKLEDVGVAPRHRDAAQGCRARTAPAPRGPLCTGGGARARCGPRPPTTARPPRRYRPPAEPPPARPTGSPSSSSPLHAPRARLPQGCSIAIAPAGRGADGPMV